MEGGRTPASSARWQLGQSRPHLVGLDQCAEPLEDLQGAGEVGARLSDLAQVLVKAAVASAESGIEKNTASVARKLPSKIRMRSDVSSSPIPPSCSRVSMAVFTKTPSRLKRDFPEETLGRAKKERHAASLEKADRFTQGLSRTLQFARKPIRLTEP